MEGPTKPVRPAEVDEFALKKFAAANIVAEYATVRLVSMYWSE